LESCDWLKSRCFSSREDLPHVAVALRISAGLRHLTENIPSYCLRPKCPHRKLSTRYVWAHPLLAPADISQTVDCNLVDTYQLVRAETSTQVKYFDTPSLVTTDQLSLIRMDNDVVDSRFMLVMSLSMRRSGIRGVRHRLASYPRP
jgi:hypothetical protein